MIFFGPNPNIGIILAKRKKCRNKILGLLERWDVIQV
jgi:hypothetical protein